MSRTLAPSERPLSTKPQSPSPPYKLFIWDVGTNGKQPSESIIRTLAVVEFSNNVTTNTVAHFSTSVRPANLKDSRNPAPTFPAAWQQFSSFISEHSDEQQPLLVSHNAAFDVTVLLAELSRAHIKLPSNWRFACSLLFSRTVQPFTVDNSQLALAARLGVSVKRQHHTPEDVIVLRNILKALDTKARRNNMHSKRVIPALCAGARNPAFFDRTPQSLPSADANSSPNFFITQTGTRYHLEGCKWLSRSSIPRHTPPPGFKPCRLCRPDVGKPVTSNKPAIKTPTRAQDPPKPSSTTQFFVTRTGTKYHVEGCMWLSKSKIPKDNPPQGLKPCGTCINHAHSSATCAQRESDSKSTKELRSSKSTPNAPFYITRTGSKYHVEGCKSLARSRISKTKPPIGYEPCGICLPSIAFSGSPLLTRVPA